VKTGDLSVETGVLSGLDIGIKIPLLYWRL